MLINNITYADSGGQWFALPIEGTLTCGGTIDGEIAPQVNDIGCHQTFELILDKPPLVILFGDSPNTISPWPEYKDLRQILLLSSTYNNSNTISYTYVGYNIADFAYSIDAVNNIYTFSGEFFTWGGRWCKIIYDNE